VDLRSALVRILDDRRVLDRYIDRIAHANDASVYRLVPRAVVRPDSVDEVAALFRFSREARVPLTFRAAGTSLSGQAVTDGVLVDVSKHWGRIEVLDDGARVKVQPGIIGGVVNRHLAPWGAKIGPDPASINACMMGGILANNSSGMCCGVSNNAYHTLDSIVFVLPDGRVVDTAEPGMHERFARESPRLAEGLLNLRERVLADAALRDRIRAKYRMKNTNGYSLNALLDYSRPVEILAHLMIGSEGTLGFIAEAVLRTIPDHPEKHTGLLFFPDVPRACAAIAPLRDSGAEALELMDRASLRSVEGRPGVPDAIRGLPRHAAALLVEYQCPTSDELEARRRQCERILPELPLAADPTFTRDPDSRDALWAVRKGLIPSVGAMRERGTSFIIEDVVFPVESLAVGVSELQALFAEHGYDDAIVFGHAKDGNLHFVLTQAFQDPSDVERYDLFMRGLADLVAGRHGGALKAEHGTGRNMAPFVEAEWGRDGYEIMGEIKRLIDPDGLLNPGVILNDDPRAHLTDLKALPTVEPEVDPCIECGFCERMCPSRDLTLGPRQRIVVRREIRRLREVDPSSPRLAELEADYRYAAVDTCATDGMCATACPVEIDTGSLVKRLRRESHSEIVHEIAAAFADRFALAESCGRAALRAGHLAGRLLGPGAVTAIGRAWPRGLPPWNASMPHPAGPPPSTSRAGARAVYFPSCISRVLGASPGDTGPQIMEVVSAVAERAGVPLWIPDDVGGHCCGMPFSSKGYDRAYIRAARRTVRAMWAWSDRGKLPVVLDTSPCSYTLRHAGPDLDGASRDRLERIEILDSIEFAHRHVLPGLPIAGGDRSVILHPVCSVEKMGLAGKLVEVAEAAAAEVVVPVAAGCCGFAGDRGFLLPQLTEAATRAEAAEVRSRSWDGHYSSSRTCEIGLSRATGRAYRSFWYLLAEAAGVLPDRMVALTDGAETR
jgi:D-lactate dehydrogenase